MQVPFHRIYQTGRELVCMTDCLQRDSISGNGYYTQLVQEWMQEKWQLARAFLTTSGTSALEMAMLCLEIQPGDEVIMPAYTFVSTANAVVLRGARPVFADIDPRTMNLDIEDMAARISNKTRMILPVHYAGVSCDMDSIMAVAEISSISVVEDAAQGMGAAYKDRTLGSIGHLGCLSFHSTKNITSGEGGALLINRDNSHMAKKAEIIWEKGTDRSQFLRGQTDRYTWRDIGSSFAMADLLAAFLFAQLNDMDEVTARRQTLYERYVEAFSSDQDREVITLPAIPEYALSNYHLFHFLCPSQEKRDSLIQGLKANGVESAFHFLPLHTSPMGYRLGYKAGQLPKTEDASSRLVRLPLYPDLKLEEQDYVIEQVREVIKSW